MNEELRGDVYNTFWTIALPAATSSSLKNKTTSSLFRYLSDARYTWCLLAFNKDRSSSIAARSHSPPTISEWASQRPCRTRASPLFTEQSQMPSCQCRDVNKNDRSQTAYEISLRLFLQVAGWKRSSVRANEKRFWNIRLRGWLFKYTCNAYKWVICFESKIDCKNRWLWGVKHL